MIYYNINGVNSKINLLTDKKIINSTALNGIYNINNVNSKKFC